jgi:hypothetical protein
MEDPYNLNLVTRPYRSRRRMTDEPTDMMYRPPSFSESQPEDELSRMVAEEIPTEPTSRRMPNAEFAEEAMVDPRSTAGLNLNSAVSRMSSPSATITPENAPKPRGIYTPTPDFPGETQRRMVADPNMRDTALGVTPSERAVLSAPVPENALVPYNPHAKRGGFLGTLKNIGRGALLSMSQSGGGLGEAIGAGLTGAIAGGASPKALEWAEYKTRRLPEFQRQQEIATRDAAQRENISRRIGERTGFDPNTGQETPQAKRIRMEDERIRAEQGRQDEDRDLNRELRGEQLTDIRLGRKERADATARDIAERRAAAAITRSQSTGEPVDQTEVQGTSQERWAGKVVPRAERPINPYQAANLSLAEERIRQAERHHQDTVGRQGQKETQEQEKEAKGLATKYNETRAKHSQASTEYGQMEKALGQAKAKGETGVSYKGRWISDAEVAAKKAEADAIGSELAGIRQTGEGHPNLEFDATGGIKLKRNQGASTRRAPAKDPLGLFD